MAGITRREVLVLLLWLCLQGESLDDDFLPSGAFRDDILFDMSWPGPQELGSEPPVGYEMQIQGGGVTGDEVMDGVGRKIQQGAEEEEIDGTVGMLKTMNNVLLPEEDHRGIHYLDMRTASADESYRCILPEILSWEEDMVGVAC